MTRARILKSDEYQKVLAHLAKRGHYSRNCCLVHMSHLAGLKCGQLAGLKISDVLGDDGRIKDEILLASTDERRRAVLLPQKLRVELEEYLSARFALKATDLALIHFTDTSRPLFYSQKSMTRGFSANTLSQWFGATYRGAKIKGATSGSGRRFFAMRLCDKSVAPRVIQRLLGHQQLQTTRLFCDLSPNSMRSAVELV